MHYLMKSHINAITLLLLTATINSVSSAIFETPMMQSKWVAKGTKTQCQLTHRIPGYGIAGFLLDAGEPLKFYLHSEHGHHGIASANLSDRTSAWMHGDDYYTNYQVNVESATKYRTSPRLAVNGEVAERMFAALEIGRVPTFVYTKSSSLADHFETKVAISSVHFYSTYPKFKTCRAKILPFGLKSVQDKILYFDHHSKKFDLRRGWLFKQISGYIKAVGHGDVVVTSEISSAERKFSKKWFNGRFAKVKSQLVKAGVNKNKIKKQHELPSGMLQKNIPIRIRLFGPEALLTYHYRNKSSSLNKGKKHRLDQLVRYIKEYHGNGKVIIHSHTNSSGSRNSNKLLSTKWGREIKIYLADRGISSDDIAVRSYGESRPVFGNRSREGLRQNQRVVIELAT